MSSIVVTIKVKPGEGVRGGGDPPIRRLLQGPRRQDGRVHGRPRRDAAGSGSGL